MASTYITFTHPAIWLPQRVQELRTLARVRYTEPELSVCLKGFCTWIVETDDPSVEAIGGRPSLVFFIQGSHIRAPHPESA